MMKTYTRAGYEVVKRMLVSESVHATLANPSSIRRHGDFMGDLPAGVIGSWYVDCMYKEYVRTMPDGEVYFTVRTPWSWHKDDPAPSLNVIIKAILRTAKEPPLFKNQGCDEDLLEGAQLICKNLKGKLAPEVVDSPLYKKYIGYPFDPFKQALLQAKKASLIKLVKDMVSLRGYKSLNIPEDYEPDEYWRERHWMEKIITESYNEYMDVFK